MLLAAYFIIIDNYFFKTEGLCLKKKQDTQMRS